jgi:hypothetical protein
MRLVIRPISEPTHVVDVTDRVVRVIAEELQRSVGGNHVLNMLEAERAVQALLSGSAVRAGRMEAP